MPAIFHLKGTVKHYDWGGISYIPSLLKLENKDKRPFAEYWMGTHPMGDSKIEGEEGSLISLREYAGDLPFLFKVLDVKEMLSIQVHPSKTAAKKEFARENEEGIPLDSPLRNYKDDNQKPELMVALSDFWLLHGFKATEGLTDILLNVTELNSLLPVFNLLGYPGLYKKVMEMPQEEVNSILQPLVEKIIPLYRENKLDKTCEDFWAARAALSFSRSNHDIDRGIFSIYFFNLVHVKKGEGVFQVAGLPHAYLEGQCVEIMTSSDNVLRGGLTHKHIDVKELLKHVTCEPGFATILTSEQMNDKENIYNTPVNDFRLTVLTLNPGETITFQPARPEILLITEGHAKLATPAAKLDLKPGMPSAIAFPGQLIGLTARSKATVFRASEPS